MARQIPASGINLFQLIYILVREYEEKSGQKAMNLSLGNPDTVPEEAILQLQARFAEDPAYNLHTYAEDNNINGFAEAMVELHGKIKVADFAHLKALPIPGIKTAGALMPLACGLHLPDKARRQGFTIASNLPAYDVIGTWGGGYLGAERVVWPLSGADNMRLKVERLEAALKDAGKKRADLVFVIRPGNPSAVGMTALEWMPILEHCVRNKTRLVNDAAYAGLAGPEHVSLASVAKEFPELEWIEMYSVSKTFSDPGARLGALVGSKDFVDDFNLVKGNTESGPYPPVMAAYGEFFRDKEAAKAAMERTRRLYAKRLAYVIPKLKEAGLREACKTEAGFFTLWQVPAKAFGKEIATDARFKGMAPHEAFNRLVIAETGIVGVHFMAPGNEPLIRYTVCHDVLDKNFQKRFEAALAKMKPEY